MQLPVKTTAALIAASALALFSAIDFHSEQRERNKSGDTYQLEAQQQRYQGIVRETPPNSRLGYASDREPTAAVIFGAQYILAPRVLVNHAAAPELALGNFSHPVDYAAEGQRRGLSIVKEFPQGVILYQRSKP